MKGGRERNIMDGLPFTHPLTKDRGHNQACDLTRNRTSDLSVEPVTYWLNP